MSNSLVPQDLFFFGLETFFFPDDGLVRFWFSSSFTKLLSAFVGEMVVFLWRFHETQQVFADVLLPQRALSAAAGDENDCSVRWEVTLQRLVSGL